METQFDITRRFEKEMNHLSREDQRKVAISLDRYAAAFDPDQGIESRHVYQPHKIVLQEGLDSSIYVLRVSPQLRVILTIENDPLFERKLITLIRVVKHDEMDRAFASIAESLHQELTKRGRSDG